MEMPLHNLNFICSFHRCAKTYKEEKLGKPQTLPSTNQTVIKALIISLCYTKSFLPFYGQSRNTQAWKQMAIQPILLHLLIKLALSSRCKTISQQNVGLWHLPEASGKHTPREPLLQDTIPAPVSHNTHTMSAPCSAAGTYTGTSSLFCNLTA